MLCTFFIISLVIFLIKGQDDDCQLPTCILTTVTTSDILTLASVINLTTTIVVDQTLYLKCINSTSTTVISTSTCTSCIPTKRIDTCGFSNGGFVILFEPRSFLDQMAACKYLGLDIAELSFDSLPVAAEVARKCLGQQRKVYIKSYEGEAKPCLVVNTGSGKIGKYATSMGALVEITCCTTHYPAICQRPSEPTDECLPQCDRSGCHCALKPPSGFPHLLK